jgi:hypothetical protein
MIITSIINFMIIIIIIIANLQLVTLSSCAIAACVDCFFDMAGDAVKPSTRIVKDNSTLRDLISCAMHA